MRPTALIIVSPEYNFSIPGGLKNAIDWLSRMKDHRRFQDKPFAIQSATAGPVGGARMQYHLRQVLGGLDALFLGKPGNLHRQFSDKIAMKIPAS